MNDEAEFWAGDFGKAYTARNQVNWQMRIPFWKDVILQTGSRSVYEMGCNAGWNLSAIRRSHPDVQLYGHDVNNPAILQAWVAGLGDVKCVPDFPHDGGKAELAFTAGVLIHIAPQNLYAVMDDMTNISCRYVLAIEYEAAEEEEIDYRGHKGKLWRRPYGKLYEKNSKLRLVKKWPAGPGFDNCTAWLLEKTT